MILGTPFINLITPFNVKYDKIYSKTQNGNLEFSFLKKPKARSLNIIKVNSIYNNEINVMIKEKKLCFTLRTRNLIS